MKTLVNKNNPAIRIIAPEIESSYGKFYTLPDKDFHHLFKMETWTLVEEEPEVDLEKAADAFALKKYPSFTAENYDLVMAIRKAYANGFKAGAEWQKKQISEYLDKWMEHATRGSEKGNHIYHLGKIALILDIQEWLKEDKETPSNSVEV